ncbi:hypothetical protein MYCGRDRAFT_98544 [Lecanosticta acicola]|uniref:Uncharacterized protein n=1 Tax=Lecanosticta acicola TaxID=111012 RepID=A0AAI8YWJ0_9PEZI|nr:hypothetical protein MYCGRDRAFT_98544 [Lecanosticta acicola]
MGVCASCLGLNRHPSQDGDHLDRLLDSEQQSYGTADDTHLTQPDEEELMREREALEHITAQAADDMIDVLHPSHDDWHHNPTTMSNHDPQYQPDSTHNGADNNEDGEEQEAGEAAWLESIQSAGLGQVQAPQRGTLAMDMGVLRDRGQHQKPARAEPAH